MSAEPLDGMQGRQPMLFGDPLEGRDGDDVGYRGPNYISSARLLGTYWPASAIGSSCSWIRFAASLFLQGHPGLEDCEETA